MDSYGPHNFILCMWEECLMTCLGNTELFRVGSDIKCGSHLALDQEQNINDGNMFLNHVCKRKDFLLSLNLLLWSFSPCSGQFGMMIQLDINPDSQNIPVLAVQNEVIFYLPEFKPDSSISGICFCQVPRRVQWHHHCAPGLLHCLLQDTGYIILYSFFPNLILPCLDILH